MQEIPGSGRSPGEGIGYPLQYSWASLVAQPVKNLPAMQETWVRSLSWEDSPGEGKGYPLQYSGLKNSMDSIVHGVAKSQTQTERLSLQGEKNQFSRISIKHLNAEQLGAESSTLIYCHNHHHSRLYSNTDSALTKWRFVVTDPAGEIIPGSQNHWKNQHQQPSLGATLSFFLLI